MKQFETKFDEDMMLLPTTAQTGKYEGDPQIVAAAKNFRKISKQNQAHNIVLEEQLKVLNWQRRTFACSVSKEFKCMSKKLDRLRLGKKQAQLYSRYIRDECPSLRPYMFPVSAKVKWKKVQESYIQLHGNLLNKLEEFAVKNPVQKENEEKIDVTDETESNPEEKSVVHANVNFSADNCISKYSFVMRNTWEAEQIVEQARIRAAWVPESTNRESSAKSKPDAETAKKRQKTLYLPKTKVTRVRNPSEMLKSLPKIEERPLTGQPQLQNDSNSPTILPYPKRPKTDFKLESTLTLPLTRKPLVAKNYYAMENRLQTPHQHKYVY